MLKRLLSLRTALSLLLMLTLLVCTAGLAEELTLIEEDFVEVLDDGFFTFPEEEAVEEEPVEEEPVEAEPVDGDAVDRAVLDEPNLLNATSITLYLGREETFQLFVDGYIGVTWTSSKPKVATVSEDGTVTALTEGTTKITGKFLNDAGKYQSVTCKVTVNGVKYRALLIGNTYKNTWLYGNVKGMGKKVFYNNLIGPAYDVKHMTTVLKGLKGTKYSVSAANNLVSSKLEATINKALGKADYNDVSLIYFSGHGGDGGTLVMNDGEEISPIELKSMLSSIFGYKIIIVDACHSGGLVGRDAAASFNSAFISAFTAADDGLGARVGEFDKTSEYWVITACSMNELSSDKPCYKKDKFIGRFNSWSYGQVSMYAGGKYYVVTSDGKVYRLIGVQGGSGQMTMGLVTGLGYDFKDYNKLGALKKDAFFNADLFGDDDGVVSMVELKDWIELWSDNEKQNSQCYFPYDETVPFFKRGKK